MAVQSIKDITSIVFPWGEYLDDYFTKQERKLLLALSCLIEAESGEGILSDPIDNCRRCRQVLQEANAAAVAGKRSVLWPLLERFKRSYKAGRLGKEGWSAWLEASISPEVLSKFTVPGLLGKLNEAIPR